MSERERLDALYRRTRYVVRLAAGELELRVGRLDPAADERLRREAGCLGAWALVTPCNPRSQPLSPAENARRYAAFRDELIGHHGVRFVPAVGRDPDGGWDDEEGFLLVDPPAGLPVRLAREWAQNAVVTGAPGAAPELVWVVD